MDAASTSDLGLVLITLTLPGPGQDRTRRHPAGGYTVFSRLEESKLRESFYNILRRPLIVNRAFSLLNAPINAFTLKNL